MAPARWWRERSSTSHFGRAAEGEVATWLKRRGYRVLERNHRNPGGELDLIARDGEVLVFLEVKARSRTDHGGALAAIDREKRRRVVRAATVYLARSGWEGDCRFDVVAVEQIDGAWRFLLYQGAFEAE